MAIHEGNSDFKLTVVSAGTKKIRIRWNRKATGLQKILEVYRPGDGKMIYRKVYDTATHSGDVTVTVPYFGQYRVKINTARGQVWDALKHYVRLPSTVVSTRTYTQADVDKWKRDQLIVTFAFAAVGLSSKAAIAGASALVSLYLTSSEIWHHDTKKESILAPRKGWKLRSKIEPIAGGVRYSFITLTPDNGVAQTVSRTAKYIPYSF